MRDEVKPPVLLLHGLFGRPALLQPWAGFFEAAGFDCYAPALPGRDPTDEDVLRCTSVRDCVDTVLAARDRLGEPPIVIGHSMGGLLGQKLAAARECAALVLLASIPPGVLWPQLRALPHLLPLLPGILAGRAILPSASTMAAVPLSTLPAREKQQLIPRLVPDSGRVFRAMTFGTPSMRVQAEAVRCPVLCVSAGAPQCRPPDLEAHRRALRRRTPGPSGEAALDRGRIGHRRGRPSGAPLAAQDAGRPPVSSATATGVRPLALAATAWSACLRGESPRLGAGIDGRPRRAASDGFPAGDRRRRDPALPARRLDRLAAA